MASPTQVEIGWDLASHRANQANLSIHLRPIRWRFASLTFTYQPKLIGHTGLLRPAIGQAGGTGGPEDLRGEGLGQSKSALRANFSLTFPPSVLGISSFLREEVIIGPGSPFGLTAVQWWVINWSLGRSVLRTSLAPIDISSSTLAGPEGAVRPSRPKAYEGGQCISPKISLLLLTARPRARVRRGHQYLAWKIGRYGMGNPVYDNLKVRRARQRGESCVFISIWRLFLHFQAKISVSGRIFLDF